jgi:hypothetical protein
VEGGRSGLGVLGRTGAGFAHALGAEVTVLSQSLKKTDDGLRLGADHCHATGDPVRKSGAACQAVRVQRDPSLDQLGAFLKARRAQLGPGDVGLSDAGEARRVPGLCRGRPLGPAISTDYHTRLEQGRLQASGADLDALAKVLRLDTGQREYLLTLAGKTVLPLADRMPRMARMALAHLRMDCRRNPHDPRLTALVE